VADHRCKQRVRPRDRAGRGRRRRCRGGDSTLDRGHRRVGGGNPDQVDAVQLDVTDPAQITAVVEDVLRRHGRIDVLVNNAGRTAVLPQMRERRGGAIVQLSSMARMSAAGPKN
jgi:NAD(P)-dependent dehydrogenase (short-subunit alcohol dehydrogenase family)